MGRRIVTAIAAAIVIAYFAMIARYVMCDGLLDHVEATVCCDAWLWATGHPLYHAPDAPERYAILYGPGVFMAVGVSLKALGPTLVAAKLPGTAAAIAGILLSWVVYRPFLGWRRSLQVTAIVVLGAMCFRHMTYWVRPDPFELLAVAAAMLAVTRAWRLTAVLVLAAATGVCANLKIHGVLYVLPLYALLFDRFGFWAVIITTIGSMLFAAAPFALPGISLTNYLAWLGDATHHGINSALAWRAVLWLALAFTAMIWSSLALAGVTINLIPRRLCEDSGFGWLLVASLLLTALFASKAGAGPHHLAPLFPVIG